MASQKWIFDPPPPPPPKRTSTDVPGGNSGQRGNYGRGRSVWSGRGGHGRHQRDRNGNHGQGQQQRQWQQNLAGPSMAAPFVAAQTGYFPSGYQHLPFPAYQPSIIGFPPNQFPLMYPQYGSPEQYQDPRQQYPVAQLIPQKRNMPQNRPEQPSRKLPVYPQQPPLQNSYGYSMSSTAFSLASHHFEPQPEKAPELSEDEIRFALENAKAKNRLSIPIQGTSIRLDTVEDIVAWREERKRKWLTKIAAKVVLTFSSRNGGSGQDSSAKNSVKIARQKTVTQAVHLARKLEATSDLTTMNEESDDTQPKKINVREHTESMGQNGAIEDVKTGDLSEGEIFVPKKSRRTVGEVKSSDEKDLKSKPKSKTKQATNKRGKQSKPKVDKKGRSIPQSSNDATTKAKPVSLRTALLQNQLERENIVLLQTLLHFREHGLLDLDS